MNRWLQKWVARFGLESRPRLRRFLLGTIGFSVVLIGLVMIVLPGPAIIHLASLFWPANSPGRAAFGGAAPFWFRASAANPFRGNQSRRDDMTPNCLAFAAEHRLPSLCAQRSFTPLM